MKNIIFIAPPSAGKGTVSDYLVKKYGYVHLSTGDMLRNEVARGSELGKEIDTLISAGKFVSDELIIRLVREALLKEDIHKPFILDGFPRTLVQAHQLDQMLFLLKIIDYVVIYLDINLDTAIKRALGRVVCPKCKRSYNIYCDELKPKLDNLCDECNVLLEKRNDDTEETFRERYQTYLVNTNPIIKYYQDRGLLVTVDATEEINMVYQNIDAIINNRSLKRENEE